ncbi:winged helix-turn-helix domain-containing protein [Leptospira licerasiae]|uniref:winged helix-turn-helix domain-containing protein n=1 Tax=Leptospira licerasiae TaxID=447106 RepID=UPI001083A581|nr:winged helix-turn-helix domain-containing protein [Leptospira licerasiae]TGM85382.1 hypothetical protein EHR05_19485 [Leptospira licerasiae]
MSEKTWLEAIKIILEEHRAPMHYSDLADTILERELKNDVGATPANSVYATLYQDIKNKGNSSEFVKTGTGYFALKRHLVSDSSIADSSQEGSKELIDAGIITAFGMFWNRNKVVWESNSKLYGKQNQNSKSVNFSNQIGVYILYDVSRPIYVGRTTDQTIGIRLYNHTYDRLSGRWDRFSWFGLKEVNEDGSLSDYNIRTVSAEHLIVSLEAILIESLEPGLNRKRGDSFSAVEYLQDDDPKLKDRQLALLLSEIQGKLSK